MSTSPFFSSRAAIVLFTFALLGITATSFAQHADSEVPSSEAMKLLKEGNKRFMEGKHKPVDYATERTSLEKSQHPYAIILCCSDSRVPPERVFDESLGKLFVVRIAGNVADSAAIGSIEYAAEHLGVHLIVVLGHESCGAVKATIGNAEASPYIKSIMRRIQPAADRENAKGTASSELLDKTIEENVREQMNDLLVQSEVLRTFNTGKSIQISGGVYRLGSGSVSWVSGESSTAPSK